MAETDQGVSTKAKLILVIWAVVLCAMFVYVPASKNLFSDGALVQVMDISGYYLITELPEMSYQGTYLINYKVILMQVLGWTVFMFSVFIFVRK